jgi:diacylglycerol kinase (ATP)
LKHQPSGARRRKFLVIYNPAAGRRSRGKLAALTERLQHDHGAWVTIRATEKRGDAERFAREATPDQGDALIVAGGDGAVGEAINGLMTADGAPGPWVAAGRPFGVAPMGTANVLAAELGLPNRPAALAATLTGAPVRLMHVGLAGGRAFSMMVGVGLDAHVVEKVDRNLKRWTGKGAYVVETLAQLLAYRGGAYTLEIDGVRHTAAAAVVANGHYYGGRFVCAPKADLFDPALHVCLFPQTGRLHALRYLWGMVSGRLAHFHDFKVIPAACVRIEGRDGEAAQGDGDLIGALPLEVRAASFKLPVIVGERR